jgi:hypothetical protein
MKEGLLKLQDEVNQILHSNELEGDVDWDEGPSIIVYIKKSNDCFSAERMGGQFSNEFFTDVDGMGKTFMDDYTTLNDMELQLRVVNSIGNLIAEDTGMDLSRIYLGGENIVYEFNPDEELLYSEDEELEEWED